MLNDKNALIHQDLKQSNRVNTIVCTRHNYTISRFSFYIDLTQITMEKQGIPGRFSDTMPSRTESPTALMNSGPPVTAPSF